MQLLSREKDNSYYIKINNSESVRNIKYYQSNISAIIPIQYFQRNISNIKISISRSLQRYLVLFDSSTKNTALIQFIKIMCR